MSKIGPFMVGNTRVELVPHYVEGVGARMFMILDDSHGNHTVQNMTATDARALASQLMIAACDADSQERRAHQKPLETNSK